jgi:LysR family transcriptional regulator, regulator for bpeEF and oprC
VDVAVRVGAVKTPNLIARRIVRTRLITCATPEYLKKYGTPTEPEQLRDHKLIGSLSNTHRRPYPWVFQKGSLRRKLPFRFSVAFNSAEARTQAALRGTGIVQTMDLLVAELLASDRLSLVLKEWSADGQSISIVYPSTLRESLKVRVFAAFAAQLLEEYRRHVDRVLALRPS